MLKLKYFFLVALMVTSSHIMGQIAIHGGQENLVGRVNSSSDERNVVVSPDGNRIYFTRSRHAGNVGGTKDLGDVWVSEKTSSGGWTDAVNMGKPLNDEGENRIIGFMDDGRAMLLHSERGIGFAYNENGKWLKPTEFKIPYFKSLSNELSGSISGDGRYLLFAMQSYGTYGVEDLYMCKLKGDGSWTSPKNLGYKINTSQEERTPFIAADNKTLFFSSNGRGGSGSFDVFMAQRLDDTWQNWSKPVNLGTKVNSNGQELSFVFRPEAEFAYLVSTQNSDGYGDIKRVKIKPDIEPEEIVEDTVEVVAIEELEQYINFKGMVKDKKTEELLSGISVHLLTDPDSLSYDARSLEDGSFNIDVRESSTYEVTLSAPGYLGFESTVTDAEVLSDSLRVYYLEPIKEGNTIQLSHVLFHQGTANFIKGSEKELDLVANMMKENPEVEIFLSGHTDNQGKAALNIRLSMDRVAAVKSYLVTSGINAKRIEGRGFGGSKPIASNASEESRKLNRRVEFTIQKSGN